MSENFFDKELRLDLAQYLVAGLLLDEGDSSNFFRDLVKSFPVAGSKISWGKVSNSIERFEGIASNQPRAFTQFFKEMVDEFSLRDDIVYVGDSATSFAIRGKTRYFEEILSKLFEIPQHHYFIGPKYSWCISLTMEGWMGFGFNGQQKILEMP